MKATQNASSVLSLRKDVNLLKTQVTDLTAKSNKQPAGAASSSAASSSDYNTGFEAGVTKEREALKKQLRFIESNLLIEGSHQQLAQATLRTVCCVRRAQRQAHHV